MRTQFFTMVDLDNASLRRELDVLGALGGKKASALAAFLSTDFNLLKSEEAMGADGPAFLRESGISAHQFEAAKQLCLWILDAQEQYGDQIADLISDFAETADIPQSVSDFLRELGPGLAEASKAKRKDKIARDLLPALTGVNYSCDLRADLPAFDAFRDDASKRNALPREWIAVAILRFSTDEDPQLTCQVNVARLRRLIAVLQAAERDLVMLEKLVSDGKILRD